MYGKKRITLSKKGVIAIEGNRTYTPIGKFFKSNDNIIGKLRKPENPYELILNETNSFDFNFSKPLDLRKYVANVYEKELKNNF